MAPEIYRRLCSKFPKGVTVVTASKPGWAAQPIGMTVSSFTGVSLDPPTVLICLRRESYLTQFFLQAPFFCVNVLSQDQREISQQFARRGVEERFQGVLWHYGTHNVPVLPNTIAHLICETGERVPNGDHIIIFGQVLDGGCCEDKYPLVHWSSDYQYLIPQPGRHDAEPRVELRSDAERLVDKPNGSYR